MSRGQTDPFPPENQDQIETLRSSALETPKHDVAEKPPVQKVHYRIVKKLGEVGMGEVYEAEQLEPVRRKVALKLIKRGIDSKLMLSRFELEWQALALMNRANIARIFDGGMSDQGRPYFVMEYVRGIPINRYCDSQCLNTRQRLELFIQVCEGMLRAQQVSDPSEAREILDWGVQKIEQELEDQ